MKNKRKIGIILIFISAAAIFTASFLNTAHRSEIFSSGIYVYDIISTFSIVTLALGAVLLLKGK